MYYLRKDQRTPSPQTRCPVTSPNLSEPLLRRERQKKRRRRRRGNVAPAAAAVAARCSDFRSFSGLLRDFTSNRVSKAHLLLFHLLLLLRHLLVFNGVCLAAAWRVLLTVLTCGAAFVLLADSVVVCSVCCVRFRVTRLLGLLQRLLARLPRNLLLRFFLKNPLLS